MKQRPILLVEDNADDELLTVRALRKKSLGNPIVVARDGAEALDYLFATGRHTERPPEAVPRVVFLDLKLPKVDGLEVLRRMRSDGRTRRVPVVVLTSSKEEKDLAASYDLGANSYVQKPVDFAAFLSAAEQLQNYWLGLNEVCPR